MRTQQGVTLLEAMMALAIMALIIGGAMPSARQWHGERVLSAQVRDLRGLMQQAQMASLDHGRPWTLCGSRDGRRCDGRWQFLLVLDSKGTVRYRTPTHDAVTLRWKGLSQALIFHPRLSSSALNGTFYLCHARRARRLIVNRLGRVRVQNADSDC